MNPDRNNTGFEQVVALIASSDLSDLMRAVYEEALLADMSIFYRTGASKAYEGFKDQGAAWLINTDFYLRSGFELSFTPQTIEALLNSAEKRKLAAKFTTGADLFKELRDCTTPIKNTDQICAAASLKIKREYIDAVAGVFGANEKGRKILQQMINYATGVGDMGEETGYSRLSLSWSRSYSDRINNGISYLAGPLELKPVKGRFGEGRHPALIVLERFIRSLPYNEKYDLDAATTKVKPKEVNADGFTRDEQLARDELYAALFGKRGGSQAKPTEMQ